MSAARTRLALILVYPSVKCTASDAAVRSTDKVSATRVIEDDLGVRKERVSGVG